MQEGILQIGDAVYSSQNEIDNILLKLETVKKGKQQHILKINFNTKEGRIEIDVNEEIDDSTSKKYMFVDKIGGPNSPQWLVSKNSCQYHLTETIPNLCEQPLGKELKEKILLVKELFFVDLGDDVESKYRYVLDLKKAGICDKEIKDILSEFIESVGDKKVALKKQSNEYKKYLQEYVKNKFDLKLDNEVSVYTILVDGIALAEYEEYRKLVVEKKLGTSESKSKNVAKNNNYCSMCGEQNKSGDITKLVIKFFTTNQVIFASDLEKKNYFKNMIVCENCLKKMLSAERYIKDNLNTKLCGFDLYLIPHFVFGEPLCKEDLDEVCYKIKNTFNMVKSYEGIQEFRNELQNVKDEEDEEYYFLLNLVFYKKVNQGTKVRRLIKDINPSVFEEIAIQSNKVTKEFKNIFGDKFKTTITLQSIYYLTPIRLKQGEAQEFNKVLTIYDSLFTKRKIRKEVIIDNIIQTVSIQHFDKKSYNVKHDENNPINFTLIQGNMLLKFLEYMGCIKEGKELESFQLNVKEEMKEYINEMNYNQQQTAMFLLGYMMGQVGNSQYKRSTEGKKAILNKLNFGGVDKSKILRLCNEVFNKLNQEKILKYNEMIFSECKRLIDSNLSNWKLNKNENLFYILSGYAYSTTVPMLRNKEEGGKENEQ